MNESKAGMHAICSGQCRNGLSGSCLAVMSGTYVNFIAGFSVGEVTNLKQFGNF